MQELNTFAETTEELTKSHHNEKRSVINSSKDEGFHSGSQGCLLTHSINQIILLSVGPNVLQAAGKAHNIETTPLPIPRKKLVMLCRPHSAVLSRKYEY